MASKRAKNKAQSCNQANEICNSVPQNPGISKDEMIEIIAAAIVRADEIKANNQAEQQSRERENRLNSVGYKDYSKRKPIARVLFKPFNRIACFLKLLFISSNKISGTIATDAIVKLTLQAVFRILWFVLWLFAVAFIAYPFIQYANQTVNPANHLQYLCDSFSCVVFAQLFRMASIEIDRLKDNNYLLGVSAAIFGVVAIIISVILR